MGTAETGADPRLACDFCGSTYNMRTGAPVKKEKGKMLGFLFSKSEDKTLPVYGLGEQGKGVCQHTLGAKCVNASGFWRLHACTCVRMSSETFLLPALSKLVHYDFSK